MDVGNALHPTGSTPAEAAPNFDIASILRALQIIHSPSTTNDVRRQASQYLEQLKGSRDAAEHGYTLARDPDRPALVRHFGLSLLEHVIRHEDHKLSDKQNEQLRNCVVDLGRSLHDSDPAFVRNKIAGLWVELAKRSWALDWYDLDEIMVQLWSQDLVKRALVLTVLENLSEDVFTREDPTAVMRGRDLNSALVEILTSPSDFTGGIKAGGTTQQMRFGDEGWLSRISSFLAQCNTGETLDGLLKSTCLKALATFRSVFSWMMTPSIVHARCLSAVASALAKQDADVVLAAVDTLLALYGRSRLERTEVVDLVYPLCQESTPILHHMFIWSIVGVEDIDSPKYLISKKLSELVSYLSDLLSQGSPPSRTDLDVSAFLALLVAVAEHDSLIVSIPAVHSWDKLLQVSSWRRSSAVEACLGPIIQFASQRIVQYDQMPDDWLEPAVTFVNEEIELHSERQGFFSNYRRFCASILEHICYSYQDQAIDHLLIQVDKSLDDVVSSEAQFDPSTYRRPSMTALQADAQFTIVDAAFKGAHRWQSLRHDPAATSEEQKRQQLGHRVKTWSSDMLARRTFRDPLIKQRQIKTAVEVSNRALDRDTGFAFEVLQHILSAFVPFQPDHPAYSDGVGELHIYATGELRRLALQHADYFATFYDQLEAKFGEITAGLGVDEKVQLDLKSSLFLVVQRALTIDAPLRQERMKTFLRPISACWQDPHLQESLSTFESFFHQQGFDRILPYLVDIQATQQPDWSVMSLDAHAGQIQKDMLDSSARVPLRETRILLSVSTDKLEPGSQLHVMVCELWVPLLPMLLENVLRIVSYSHRLHDPLAWPDTPPGIERLIQRVLRDRYWQSGISQGSMTDFHSKVKSTKSSLEGFASSVRGQIRTNLENCYSIIHTLGRLGPHFYGLQQVPDKIADSLLNTAGSLSPHHFGVMLSMLPKLIDDCPSDYRDHFLPPILATLLRELDVKCTNDWNNMNSRKETTRDDESLSDEMRDDSVLRQTTYRAVNMVALWLDPQRELQLDPKRSLANGNTSENGIRSSSMRDFVLSSIRILEPLLLFCIHALAFKDTKACATMIAAAQRLVVPFATEVHLQGQEAAAVREFISSEMLKTVITSLNDGYFADYHHSLANLVATIWLSYGLPIHVTATETNPAHDRPALTQTPRNILLSLPGMTEAKVDDAGQKLLHEGVNGKARKLRAIVLQLLDSVRGVRLSELGRIDTRQQLSRILEKYKQRDAAGMQGLEDHSRRIQEDGVDLVGVADMFG